MSQPRLANSLALLTARPVVWLLISIPAWPLIVELFENERYYAELMWESGIWSVQLMVGALAITPVIAVTRPLRRRWTVLNRIAGWLMQQRRGLGVASFGYALIHLLFYIRQTGSLELVWLEIPQTELALGWAAFAILLLLAATSNSASVRLMGRAWKPLQRLSYMAAALTGLHWFWFNQFLDTLLIWVVLVSVMQAWRIAATRRTSNRSASAPVPSAAR